MFEAACCQAWVASVASAGVLSLSMMGREMSTWEVVRWAWGRVSRSRLASGTVGQGFRVEAKLHLVELLRRYVPFGDKVKEAEQDIASSGEHPPRT